MQGFISIKGCCLISRDGKGVKGPRMRKGNKEHVVGLVLVGHGLILWLEWVVMVNKN